MSDGFYRSGQAAKQLGVSSYHVRRLCEVGEITAELTAGQQWRIPASEIARLRREGVPDIPVESDDGEDSRHTLEERDDPSDGLLASPSAELIEAAEQVKIVENRLSRRRVEKEREELEDWFRDRDQQQAERAASEKQKAEAARAEQRRRIWFDSWIQYALRMRPYDAPKETELEIHSVVQEALATLNPDQPQSTTERLVDAAVDKALRPWTRQKEIRRAIESAMNRLPWDINYGQDWVSVKQQAWEAAAAAVGKMRTDATSHEMQEMAWSAVQPMAREHARWKAARDMAASIFLSDGTYEEMEQAREAVREALARLPIGTSQREMERIKDATLEPFQGVIRKRKADAQQREEQDRRDREKAWQLAVVEARVDRRLTCHLGHYLRKLENDNEIECESASDRWELEKDLKGRIRPMLVAEVRNRPDMSDQEINGRVEDLVDNHIGEFLED